MCNDIWGWMVAGLILGIILHYIQILNPFVYLKLIQCYVNCNTIKNIHKHISDRSKFLWMCFHCHLLKIIY